MDKSHSSQVKGRKKGDISGIEEQEKSCASTLKEVHLGLTQSSAKKQQEAACLEELGDIYVEKSKLTNSGRDYTKAAGLFNAAMARYSDESETETVKRKLANLVQIFIETELEQSCDEEYRAKYAQDITGNKQNLKKLREYCKQELDSIANKYPAYEEDGFVEGLNVLMTSERRKSESDRGRAIEQLYLHISDEIKFFVGQLLDQCIEVMGQPPCKYAWVGLGSLSRDMATPYSDLESAILIEEEKEDYKRYFRLLSYFLHIKVIDLGQTIIPILAIKSLYNNDYGYSWFQDFITPRGFSLDGNVPWASKNPYGREATPMKPEPMELIKSPFKMANLQTEESVDNEGYHLADILVDTTLIKGDNELVDQYKRYCHEILSKSLDKVEVNTNDQIKSVKQARGYSNLQAGIKEFDITTTLNDKGRLYNVKKEIYRFPTIVINSLSWIFNINSSNLWNAIRELYKRGVINLDAKHNLLVAISLAAELRLASYIKHGKQSEELVVRESGSFDDERILLPSNQQKLIRYYLTALPFKDIIERDFNSSVISSSSSSLQNNHFYQRTYYYKGKIYERLTMYSEAEISYKRALEEREEESHELNLDLAWLQIQQGKLEESKITIQNYSEKYPGKQIVRMLKYLGEINRGLGDNDKAMEYHQESLAAAKQIYGQDAVHPDIALSLMNLGSACYGKGDYDKAVEYYHETLAMQKQIYGQDAANPDIAKLLMNLGSAWLRKGDYDKAVEYYQESLAMQKQIYGQDAAHPDIAKLLVNLGSACYGKGDYDKGVEYWQETLAMQKQIYGQDAAHPDIAILHVILGIAWHNKGDYDKAVEYWQETLAMQKQIYGQDVAHPDIAKLLINLGNAFQEQSDYDKAVEYYQESLAMQKQIYGQDAAHPDIAKLLSNLGCAWHSKGDYDKAVECHQESLAMKKQIFGQNAAHPSIATSLNNLGELWVVKGDYDKAVECHQESLAMNEQIFGQDAVHPNIAGSLNNLGKIWVFKGDYEKAFKCYNQALQIYQTVFGLTSTHPHKRELENNLKELQQLSKSLM